MTPNKQQVQKKMWFNLKPIPFDLMKWRKDNKMSGRKFAELVGVNYSYVCRLENEIHTASPEVALKIFKGIQKYQKSEMDYKIQDYINLLNN
jgi:transcriptional regulator with XRE-family HTH domain